MLGLRVNRSQKYLRIFCKISLLVGRTSGLRIFTIEKLQLARTGADQKTHGRLAFSFKGDTS